MPMTLALAALLVSPQEMSLEPTDDVWVYSFAQDQASDGFLRSWGAPEGAVSAGGEGMGFSYSLLRFQIPEGAGKVARAELVLTHAEDAKFSAEESKAAPLEARPAPAGFEEETWDYGMHPQFLPEARDGSVYGAGHGSPTGTGTFAITIDLTKGPNSFAKAWESAAGKPGRTIALALTTRMRPDEAGDSRIYKVYSRNSEPKLRPRLVVAFD